jgi:hypothetical protein
MIVTSVTLASSTALRLQFLAGRLHALGPRSTFEFLAEIAGGADMFERLERYARLDPDIVHALGGDVMPPVVRLVK